MNLKDDLLVGLPHRDGRLLAAILAVIVLHAASCAPTQTPQPPDPTPKFRAIDTNGDGQIDRAEYDRHARDEFSSLDRDKDGYLTRSELAEVTDEAIRAADGDSDGRLTVIEYMNERLREFSAADRNRDGVLTRAEVDGYGFALFRWR
jgi:hypothetical protein